MSSNTLRGIGQEADGDGDGDGVATPPLPGTSAVGTPGSQGAPSEPAGKLTDRMQELRGTRSLDSTIPGTRSLDASVPDARPSLDAKVPALAATLMGVAPPTVGRDDREKGTVQGRDVHLPVESRRVAEARVIADSVPPAVGTTTISLDRPAFTDKLSSPELADGTNVSGSMRRDLNSHDPRYQQDPTGGDPVYDEQPASVVGRAAIGVAVAAALSVLVFAVIRLNGADPVREDGAARSRGTSSGDSVAAPTPPQPRSPPPQALIDPSSVATEAPSGVREPTAGAPSTPAPSLEGNAASAAAPDEPTPGFRAAGTGTDRRTAPGVAAARTGRSVPRVSPPARSAAASTDSSAGSPPTAGTTPPPLLRPAPEGLPPANSTGNPTGNSGATAPLGPAGGKAAGTPDRARGKAGYDPDSTLPLNID